VTATSWYLPRGKRTLDVVVASIALLVASPCMLLVAIAIAATMGRPVLFRQLRPGFREQPFVLLKFRTMAQAHDAAGDPLPDDLRLTWLGRWLRAASLDELPGLINVLRGEMSLVGPRPLLMEYLGRYTEAERRRHDVLPGITGLAQVRGRNAISWTERFELDLAYVEQCHLWLDLRILAETLWVTLVQRGIREPGHVTRTKLGHDPTGSA